MEELSGSRVAWAVASQPHPAQSVTGDGYVVKRIQRGLLAAVVDGLGHGADAAAAAALCIDTLAANAELPILTVLRHCHERLRGTRGATVSVAVFDFEIDTLTWSGVGDVVALLVRADETARPKTETLVPRAGLLGSGSPALVASNVALGRDDVIVLATDGIEPGFERSVARSGRPQALADRILNAHAKRTDDALVLVARYAGLQP